MEDILLQPTRETNNSDTMSPGFLSLQEVSDSVYAKVIFKTCFLRVMSLFSDQLFSQTEKPGSHFFLPNTHALYHP